MLNLNILCTRFERIIIAVQVGAVKIYVTAVEALRKKKKDLQFAIASKTLG
jgi:hypothetical protein